MLIIGIDISIINRAHTHSVVDTVHVHVCMTHEQDVFRRKEKGHFTAQMNMTNVDNLPIAKIQWKIQAFNTFCMKPLKTSGTLQHLHEPIAVFAAIATTR